MISGLATIRSWPIIIAAGAVGVVARGNLAVGGRDAELERLADAEVARGLGQRGAAAGGPRAR